MRPYKVEPVLKEKIWGGQKLKQYHKNFGEERIGESWETDKDIMPILIKLIDANDVLSVQVHPSDVLAWELERQTNGKTEAWIVLDCEEGAELIAGVRAGVSRECIKNALKSGTVETLLNIIKVKKGDCIYIPAGTVHSLGKGIVIYEVQQPSDLTYRLYDYNRLDDKGLPRELHIEKALRCINYNVSGVDVKNLYEMNLNEQQLSTVFQNEYFKTSYLKLRPGYQFSLQATGFTAITAISGTGLMNYEGNVAQIHKGETWIIPVEYNAEVSIESLEPAEYLISEHI